MHINVSETMSGQPMIFDEPHHLFMLRLSGEGERLKQGEDFRPVLEMSAREFADDERVADRVAVRQQALKPGLSLPQMRHPDRAVDQDHPIFAPFFCEESASVFFQCRPIRPVAYRFPC